MTVNRFEPIHQAHAIAEMVMFFEFLPGLGTNIERLLPLRSELEADFPASDLLEVVQFTFGAQPSSAPQSKAGGIELRRFKPDGSFEWLIRITPQSISIHCLEYTRWKYVWDKVNGYADRIFAKLAGIDVGISGIGLKYVDQFVFQGELDAYNADLLFRRESSLLHARAFSSEVQWHCHTGWFQNAGSLGEVLSQMNVESAITNVHTSQRAVVVIDHTFTRRAQREGELTPYLTLSKTGLEARSNLAQWMHDANKELLSDLLIDTVRERISLNIDE